ncbi:MAG: hypothetical protein H6R19_3661 [Proteobacteria bacterium]|nr:hypothetical protein [Pseudomonadota bacterium]
MRLKRTLAFCLGAALGAGLLAGCAPKVDQSGWEIARKKSPTERLESFPEIPVVLPGTPLPPQTGATGSPMEGVLKKSLDVGSLFRRGYTAPSP